MQWTDDDFAALLDGIDLPGLMTPDMMTDEELIEASQSAHWRAIAAKAELERIHLIDENETLREQLETRDLKIAELDVALWYANGNVECERAQNEVMSAARCRNCDWPMFD